MRSLNSWSPYLIFIFSFLSFSYAGDTIAPGHSIGDGETMVSADGGFTCGFFSPGNFQLGFSTPGVSKKRYLGIWYSKFLEQTVVWVANREKPLTNSTGVLEIGSGGNLIIRNQAAGTIVWSSAPSNSSKLVAQLLDSGNLVLKEITTNASSGNIVWQSFDYPTDTLLAGMKLGWDLRIGLNRRLQSWKSTDPGNYTYEMDLHGSPQMFLMNGLVRKHRIGPWNGLRFSGDPVTNSSTIVIYKFVSNQDEAYYSAEPLNSSFISRLVINPTGTIQRFVSVNGNNMWTLYWWAPSDQCYMYDECGAYGVCDIQSSPICNCLKGFEPKSLDGSAGCLRRTPLDCQKGDGFLYLPNITLPDLSPATIYRNMSLEECRGECLRNCSCKGYATADIRGPGSGCIMWIGDLRDIRAYSERNQDIFVRVAASELGTRHHSSKKSSTEDIETPLFDLGTIATVTNNFSEENKLGEGGFGPVYKGKLGDGQHIAVKRLSKNSAQGLDEFMNEVMLIAKLQHRNLVGLLGCCIQEEERMLIYEYMQNKSLDTFIFDSTKGALLKWQKRFDIIMGIARGLLYLHQDSRLRIIHRDLKASNILLDQEMEPKISDFGTARTFRGDQIKDNTRTVVGTYGYMSPEYVINGIFSMKSDVFSFGVLVLEIVSGKKNRGVYLPELNLTLLGYAWKLWNEGNSLELLDEAIGPSHDISEVLRCLHVALLCVQEHAIDRPIMAAVVTMLGSDIVELPKPKKPGFCYEMIPNQMEWSCSGQESCYATELTITVLEGR